jgi:hypothetical protein
MRSLLSLSALVACLTWSHLPAAAQSWFNPFDPPKTSQPPPRESPKPPEADSRPYLAPMDGRIPGRPGSTVNGGESSGADARKAVESRPQTAVGERERAVERSELSPVMDPQGSGLPYELWRGLTVGKFETLVGSLEIPPRSPALHALWRRLITGSVTPPPGAESNAYFTALRVEALDRSGLLSEAGELLRKESAEANNPLISLLLARNEIARGAADRGCETAKAAGAARGRLPRHLKAESVLISGYCAARAGDMTAASLSAGIARELAAEGAVGPDALDAIASGTPLPTLPKGTLSLLEYRILEVKGPVDPKKVLEIAPPGLLAMLAQTPSSHGELRLIAGERAASLNALTPTDLGALYRAASAGTGGEFQRAHQFRAAENERTPLRKARNIRAFLDDARRAGLYLPGLHLMAEPTQSLAPVTEIGWFAETAIEIFLAVGNYEQARVWARLGSSADQTSRVPGLAHWVALTDVADPAVATGRSRNLGSVEDLALSGRFDPVLLHRLATVLDALDINVPIPLWELASRTPQPSGGHLPDTGVLTALADAAKKKEFGRTVLLAMQALGPNGAEGAHMIALGDSIRALKRAGFEKDARRLGLEALFMSWPRAVSH